MEAHNVRSNMPAKIASHKLSTHVVRLMVHIGIYIYLLDLYKIVQNNADIYVGYVCVLLNFWQR